MLKFYFLKRSRKSNTKFPFKTVYFPKACGLTSSYIPLLDIKNLQSIYVLHTQYTYILIQYTYIFIQCIYFQCNQNVRDSHL